MSKENNELPSAWQNSTLAELVDRLQYGYTAKAVNEPNGTQYLRITDIRDTSIDWPNVPRCKISEVDFPKYQLHHGDIVFARSGSIEKAARVENPPHAVFASYLIRGRPLATWIGDWLKQFIRSADYYGQIGAAGAGIGMQNVNAKKLGRVTIPIPPVPEQQRIVAKIESLQERSSRARAALAEVGPLLEQFRRSVLSAAFSGRLTAQWRAANPDVEPASELLNRIRTERRQRWEQAELAKYEAKGKKPPKNWKEKYQDPLPLTETDLPKLANGWSWARLGELAEFINGDRGRNYPNKAEYVPAGLPFINTGHIEPDGSLSLNRMNYITRDRFDTLGSGKIQKGDLVYCLRGATLGKTAFVEPFLEGAIASSLVIIRPHLADFRDYFYHFLMGPLGRQEINKYDNGSAQPNLSAASVTKYLIPIPPESELKIINCRLARAWPMANVLQKEFASIEGFLTTLDQSILAKAFRGELVPQDPADEPAAELLARIAAAREAAASSSKTSKRARKPAARKAADP